MPSGYSPSQGYGSRRSRRRRLARRSLHVLLFVAIGAAIAGVIWWSGGVSALRSTSDPGVDELSAAEIEDLSVYALELINADRAAHGLAPVVLGNNPAAQDHAEDMLAGEYTGHWWRDGRKPYMVYSSTGGTSYVSENVSMTGWTRAEWEEAGCGLSVGFTTNICQVPHVESEIKVHQWSMMYDDAHADWGHRDNILGTSHRKVNIGIAFNGIRLIFVQHFEGGDLEATERPTIEGGVFTLSVRKNLRGIPLSPSLVLYEDPHPQARTAAEIEALMSYCTGGGFTEDCDFIDSAIRILKPPPPDEYYMDLDANEIVAAVWDEGWDYLEVVADIGELVKGSDVYTVVVWGVGEQGVSGDVLLRLTVAR